MIKLIILLLGLFSQSLFAQGDENVTHFQRLLIFNTKDQLMVVKIKNTDFWVTPGLYSQTNELTNENLHKLAADFGLTVNTSKLRGIFALKNKKTNTVSNRYFYDVKVKDGKTITPDNIEEIRWLPLNEAMKTITFPHITVLLNQVINHPKVTWGGTILRYKEDNKLKSRMIKDFFPLTDIRKN